MIVSSTGYAKAEYAIGYFKEMGIGCRRDPLDANVWYVKAADQGYEAAKQRLAIIRAAASGDPGIPMNKAEPKGFDNIVRAEFALTGDADDDLLAGLIDTVIYTLYSTIAPVN